MTVLHQVADAAGIGYAIFSITWLMSGQWLDLLRGRRQS